MRLVYSAVNDGRMVGLWSDRRDHIVKRHVWMDGDADAGKFTVSWEIVKEVMRRGAFVKPRPDDYVSFFKFALIFLLIILYIYCNHA